jgi:hypothetical protein
MLLPTPANTFGMLWGSVDSYNTLSFYSNGTLVGTVTGSQVEASPNGSQSADGSAYIDITSSVAFDTVVATSSSYAFEFDDIAFGAVAVSEPGSLAMLAASLIGIGFVTRRKRA